MKKAIALLLALLIIVPLAACSQQASPSAATSEAPASESAAAPASASQETASESPAEDITLTMWTIATESDSHHEPYLKSIADYEASHPGIKIQMETFENESYKTKIKAAVAAKELPDIFFTWGGGFSTAFVQSGAVLPVDDVYAEYQNQLPKSMLGNLTWDDKIYGTGYTMNVSMLFYNKTMFAKYNLTPPTTYDELVNVCKTFIEKGITPFGISAKDTWVLAQTHDQFTLKSVGSKTLQSVLTKSGTGSYNSADFVTASTDFANLVKMGAYSKNAVALSNDEACATFYSGEVPMYIMGSWMCGSILTDAPNPDDFGVVPVPVINSSNAAVTDFMGGPSDSLMVSSTSQYPKEAAEAMFEIAKGVSHYGYLAGCGLPAWAIDYDDSTVNPLTQEVAKYVANATSFTLWFDTLMEAEDTAVYLENLQQLYLGDITPEDFCKAMSDQLGS